MGRLWAKEIAVALKSTANVKTIVFMIQSPMSIIRRTGKAAVVFLRLPSSRRVMRFKVP